MMFAIGAAWMPGLDPEAVKHSSWRHVVTPYLEAMAMTSRINDVDFVSFILFSGFGL